MRNLGTGRGGAVAAALAVAVWGGPCWSNNGMVAPGQGTTQMGMAGAGTAMAGDAAATLRNPAAGAFMGGSMTADLGMVVPIGESRASAVGAGSNIGLIDIEPGRNTSVIGFFPVPAFARNWRISDRQAWGLGVTAAGLKALSRGSSATVARGVPLFEARCDGDFGGGDPLPGSADPMNLCGQRGTALGVDLTQVLVSAHWAFRALPEFSFGVAPVFAFERVSVRGIGAFSAFSNEPERTTDNKSDYSYGGGLRLGFLWEIVPGIGLGAAYQTRLYTTELENYRGVIIDGSLDFAPTLNVGLQLHLAPEHRVLIDLEQIRYADITPLGNGVDAQRFTDGCFVPRLLVRSNPNRPDLDDCLGGPDGPGFGWENINVYKFGYQFQRGRLTLRAGYSFGGNPIGSDQTLSTYFAPAVTDKHVTLGLAWVVNRRMSIGWALVDSLPNTVKSRNALSNAKLQVLSDGKIVGFKVDTDPDDQTITSRLSVWESKLGVTWTFD